VYALSARSARSSERIINQRKRRVEISSRQ
jgi:hypothetical protein